MSIVSFIESLEKDQDSFGKTVSKLHYIEGLSLEFNNGKSVLPFVGKNPWLRIYGIEDFLKEDVVNEAGYWNFSITGMLKLTELITNFSETYQKSFLFSFVWGGNDIGAAIKNTELSQFLTIIEKNQLEELTYRIERQS